MADGMTRVYAVLVVVKVRQTTPDFVSAGLRASLIIEILWSATYADGRNSLSILLHQDEVGQEQRSDVPLLAVAGSPGEKPVILSISTLFVSAPIIGPMLITV